MPYHVKRKKIKPKRITKKTVKLYLWLTLLCLLIAAAFSFITGKGPSFVREKIDGALIAEAEKTLGRKLKHSDLDLIEKTLGIKIDPADIEKAKKAYNTGKADPADIERAGKASKNGQIGRSDAEKGKKTFTR